MKEETMKMESKWDDKWKKHATHRGGSKPTKP